MDRPAEDLEHVLAAVAARAPDERGAYLRTLGEPREVLADLVAQAERLVIGDLHRALDATAALVELADSLVEPSSQARARQVRAQALAYANQFVNALGELTRAVELAEVAGDAQAAARANLSKVHALARLGRLDEAIAAGESARHGFQTLGDAVGTAKAEANLGVTHRMAGNAAAALAHFDRARTVLAADPTGLAQVDSNRAEALLELNRFAEAEEAFRSALASFTEAGAAQAAAIVEGNLADLMSRQGRLDLALFHFERARRHFEAGHALGDLARLEAEQAEAFAGAGLHEQAADTYADAVPKLDEHGLALEAVRARTGMAKALMILGRMAEAGSLLRAADEKLGELDSTAWLARVRLLQGQLALAQGQRTQARTLLTEALDSLRDRPAEAAAARHHLAAAAVAAGDRDRAEALINNGIAAASEYDLAPLLSDLLHLRAKIGDPASALADLRAAVNEIERVRGSLQADRLRAAFMERRGTVYEDLVTALLDAGPDFVAEAFRTVEQAKSRALLDLVAGAVPSAVLARPAEDAASASLQEEAARLHADLNALYSRLPESGPAPAIHRWRERVATCERSLQAVESRLATARGPAGPYAPPVSLDQVRRLLDEGSALLEYFIAGDEVLAFVVTSASARIHRHLAGREQLEEHAELARFQIDRALGYDQHAGGRGSNLVEDARRELADLHDLLIAPLAESLAGAVRLVIIGHGPLHLLPFHAFHDGRRHLIERFNVGYAPSASLLARLGRDDGPGPPGAGLVLGVPDPATPHIEPEARAVAAALGNARLLLGPDATWERLRDGAPDAAVIHLACHGWFSPGRPLASGLKLADRWITVRDLFALSLPGSVVVLSGCETGQAAVGGGDELVGLVQGFLAAGAAALLLTLWPLDDKTAENLVASIYAFWQNGRQKGTRGFGAALRRAQLGAMCTHPHPAYWAPFILVGRP